MTIRRRLFFSNILMIIIPLLLSVGLIGGFALVLTGVVRVEAEKNYYNVYGIFNAMEQANDIVEQYQNTNNAQELVDGAKAFNKKHPFNVYMSVYKGDAPLYQAENFMQTTAVKQILQMNSNSFIVLENSAAYVLDAGEYRILVSQPVYMPFADNLPSGYRQYVAGVFIVVLLIFVSIILLTNLVLTRRMYKSIIVPLRTLSNGVQEIRDGNLEYRIHYTEKDEFNEICEDFNEMGKRLQKMVNARLRDNENRKELVAGVSHDLRTPLTAIKAYVEGLETGVASTPEQQKKYLETIKYKTRDLEHIVSQLFLFSKLDVGDFPLDMQRVELNQEIASYVSAAVDEYKKKGLEVSLHQSEVPIVVLADAVQLRSVLTNILENSLKYSGRKEASVAIKISCQATQARIVLTDNGPGIDEQHLERLFDIFYRADVARSNPSRGSGLGLSIAAKIVEGFGGRIIARNAATGGLTILIMLPLYAGGVEDEKYTGD